MSQWGTLILTELLGTALLIILGNGIVANVVLKGTKGNNAGWLAINMGWGVAVTVAAMISSAFPGGAGYLNPAVAIAKAISNFDLNFVMSVGLTSTGAGVGLFIGVLVIELVGAMIGQVIVDLVYYKHIQMTFAVKDDFATANVLGMHATGATTKCVSLNFLMEFIGTVVLVGGIMAMGRYANIPALFGPFIVGIIVLSIGLSLGGTTGYAINPARDLGPRLVHALLPNKDKGSSDWQYSWIPVAAPMTAGILVGLIFIGL